MEPFLDLCVSSLRESLATIIFSQCIAHSGVVPEPCSHTIPRDRASEFILYHNRLCITQILTDVTE